MTNDFFEYDNHSRGRCDGCCDCRIIQANGGWSFNGCFHEPYHGKWVAEIENCPKVKEEEGET